MKEKRSLIISYMAPLIVVFGFVVVFPLLSNIYYSFYSKKAFDPNITFVGLTNYSFLLQNARFWDDVVLTLEYSLGSLVLQLIVGFGVALVMDQPFRGRSIARVLVILPYMVSPVVNVSIFKWMYNDMFGLIPQIFRATNLVSGPTMILTEHPMFALILLSVYMFSPFVTICVMAGLQAIPPELYEAAELDGASWFKQLYTITLPLLKNILIVVVLLRVIWMAAKFDVPWIFLKGGPVRATETLPLLAYIYSFKIRNIGLGAGIAVILFTALVVFAVIYIKFTEEKR